MFASSRKFFVFFLTLFSISFGAFLSYVFFSFLMPVPVEIYFFIPFTYIVLGFVIFSIFSIKMKYFFRLLLAIILFFLIIFTEIIIYMKVRRIIISSRDYIIVLFSCFIFFIVDFLVSYFVFQRFKKLDMVIENEIMFESRSKYIQWVNEEYGERSDRLEPTWFIRLSTNIVILFLFFAFISVAKNSFNRIFLSFALILFCFACAGIYLILYQYSTVIKWEFLGFKVKKDVILNWNKILRIFLFLIFIISLLFPSNYIVFRVDFLYSFLRSLFPIVFTVKESMEEEISPSLNQEISAKGDLDITEWVRNGIKIGRIVILVFILLYLSFSFLGLILKMIYGNKKKIPKVVRFFISCFDILLFFILKVKDFVVMIFLDFFKFGKKEKKESEKLVKHFYTFFGEYKKLPSEKQKEIESIIKEFIRLIQVASKFILPYSFYLGPGEYMNMVSEKVESAQEEIKETVNIFNESRYSLHILSKEKIERFRKLVDMIIDKITKLF